VTADVLLEANDVSIGYGRIGVVSNLSLSVRAGEIVALVGPNGAGKSTTIMGLCGVIPHTGAIRWLGLPAPRSLVSMAKQGLALIPEERSVIKSLSVEANMQVGRGDSSIAYELFPELAAIRSRRGGSLSGGEQQMLALARALSRRPKLLVVDELSLGLAPMITKRLLAAIRDAADEGLGVLMVEQRVDFALEVADSCVVLSRGRVVLEGSTDHVRADMANLHSIYLNVRAS
jgi:branched-chain amino acid transport system ATP-binding protein